MSRWQAGGTDSEGRWVLAYQDGLLLGTPRVVVAVYEAGADVHDPVACMAALLLLADADQLHVPGPGAG